MNGVDTVTAAVVEALAGPCAVPEGTPLVAACSGGADSVALVAALGAVVARWPLRAVVFVDHGLRDVSAERDAARRAAGRADAPFVAVPVTLAAGGNLQERARQARYQTLVAHAGVDALVATGHTLDDQAETVLQRLVRGAGLRGLGAIPARDGRLVRPLLAVRRETTRSLGLPFSDDPTNATGAYQRNRMRHEVMPLLAAENPRVAHALADLAAQVRVELELIDGLADAVDLTRADLTGTPTALAEVLVRWRHRREIGGPPPRRGAVELLSRQLAAGADDAGTSLGGGIRGRARRGRLGFEVERDPRLEVVAHGPGTYRLGTLRLELSDSPARVGREGPVDAPMVAIFPAEGLRWPIKISRSSPASRMSRQARGVERDRPEPPAADAPTIGAPTTEFVITDAIGTRVWPRAVGDLATVTQRSLRVHMWDQDR